MKRGRGRRLRYFVEALVVRAAIAVSSRLTPERASGFGGWLFRVCGPLLPVSRRIDDNLRLVMAELDRPARRALMRRILDNLGRTFFEYPHLEALSDPTRGHIELVGMEECVAAITGGCSGEPLRAPLVFVSAHCANWELLPLVAKRELDLDILTVFRRPNNPRVARALDRMRDVTGMRRTVKGRETGRALLQELRAGGCVGFLVDQKLGSGIEARFFSLPAMTTDAGIRMAMRFSCPLVPVHVERVSGTRFRVVVDRPLEISRCGDDRAAIEALVQELNDMIEGWVRKRPDQWLWLHRRWTKEVYERLRDGMAAP